MATTDISQDRPPPSIASIDEASLTPAMRQYVHQKKRVGDAVLLFRMGDFYETFWDDAVTCSKVLGIALTARSKGSNAIPLAGIPYHALDGYLKKLVVAGFKVAVSEQLEDAKLAKGVVKRGVVRVVTAGTLTDDALLGERDANILASICAEGDRIGLAIVELSTARFEVMEIARASLLDELARHRPAELIIDEDSESSREVADSLHALSSTSTTRRPSYEFTAHSAEQALQDHFGVSTLAGFGFTQADLSVRAAGAVVEYLKETQKTALSHLTSVKRRVANDFLQIDYCSWAALEIDRTLRGQAREGSLLHAIDRTVHPIGGRTLVHWLRAPLTDHEQIVARQDAVGFFVEESDIGEQVRRALKNMADVQRIATRVALMRCTPRDLAALGRSLDALPAIVQCLGDCPVPFVTAIAGDMQGQEPLADLLREGVKEDPPPVLTDGGVIADGFDEELDRLRNIGQDGKTWLAEYQRQEIERTGITSLKVGFHRVFGYYLEILNSAKGDAPDDYIRKQTVKNAERYVTEALKRHETEVMTAKDRAIEREVTLFGELRERASKDIDALMRLGDAIGRLDCVIGLAALAIERRYVRPTFVSDVALEIDEGRHPVLDQVLGDRFVPNDTTMDSPASRVFVITGPNMAGKSTYIRQVAQLTLMSQIGSFVPACKMVCSIADRLFARVGASDEIMRGQSTFMVEMTEAANILHNATERSVVVLDELGRGTSTFDGLALAWAITEHLANDIGCRTLVATHYHEMTELAEILKGVRNFNVAVREYEANDQREAGIVFLHRIVEGGASKSYGVHVAKLAGIPLAVIKRSREVLDELQRSFERESRTPQLAKRKTKNDPQLSLFRDAGEEVVEALRAANPDELTPLQALQLIQDWKSRFLG